MDYVTHLLKCYPVSMLLTAVIWVLCLMPVPDTPLSDVSFADKWMHVAMYLGLCSVVWLEYWQRHQRADKLKLFLLAWLAPVLMSGLIELVQAYCTDGMRSGEWLDFAANATGVTLAVPIGILLAAFRPR